MIWIGLLVVLAFGFLVGVSVGESWGYTTAKKIWQPSADVWCKRADEYRAALMKLKPRNKKRRRRARSAPR